jgi:hypothetical protein
MHKEIEKRPHSLKMLEKVAERQSNKRYELFVVA